MDLYDVNLGSLGAVAGTGQNSDEGARRQISGLAGAPGGQCRCSLFKLHVRQDRSKQRLPGARGSGKIADRFPGYRGSSHDETRSPRRPGRSKTSLKLCSMAWLSFGLRKTSLSSSRAWPKDSVLKASIMPKKGIKVCSAFIYPSVDGVRNVIGLLGAGNEKIRRLKAEELVDDSVVKRLEKEGKNLTGRTNRYNRLVPSKENANGDYQ